MILIDSLVHQPNYRHFHCKRDAGQASDDYWFVKIPGKKPAQIARKDNDDPQ